MRYLARMLGLSVQNFLSAATGIAVVPVLLQGVVARATGQIGNFCGGHHPRHHRAAAALVTTALYEACHPGLDPGSMNPRDVCLIDGLMDCGSSPQGQAGVSMWG